MSYHAPTQKVDVAVIGGGLSGLTAAYRLKKLSESTGKKVSWALWEGSNRVGGVLQTDTQGGFSFELGPDCFLSNRRGGISLTQELGLESKVIGTREYCRRSFVLRGDHLYAIPEGFYLLAPSSPIPFLKSHLMSWKGKIRTLADFVLPRGKSDDESLESFVLRRFGREALERLAQPMAAGIYPVNPDRLSLKATMPQFLDWERKYRSVIWGLRKSLPKKSGTSGPRYSLFVSFENGMQTLSDRLIESLPAEQIHTGQTVGEIRKMANGGWKIISDAGEILQADQVVITTPAPRAGLMLRSTAPELARELSAIEYASSVTINFAYARHQVGHPLGGMGFVVPAIENRLLTACSFSSQKFEFRAPQGHVLFRTFVAGERNREHVAKGETYLVNQVRKELEEILNIRGTPKLIRYAQWNQQMPKYVVGHLGRVETIEAELTKLRGLHLAGNAYRGSGIPEVISQADTAAQKAFEGINRTLPAQSRSEPVAFQMHA